MKSHNKGKISYTLQAIATLPLFLFGIAVMILSYNWFTKIIYREVETELANAARNTTALLDVAHPGDYVLTGDIAYRLLKGEYDITEDYSLIDKIKEDTGYEITLYYQDTRVLTTIRDTEGTRLIGTGAPATVLEDVLHTGEPHFYSSIIVNGASYFAYYMPLYNSDDSIAGMLFVGKPMQNVTHSIQSSVYPLTVMVVLALVIVVICIYLYTRKFIAVLTKIQSFLADVSNGNLNAELDTCVLSRNDELGDIGRSALSMQRSLRTMVEQDALTGLFNRRCANRKLEQIIARSKEQGTPFCVALGDIDFFKKVNDTYGHDCGDLVLKTLSDIMRQHMLSCGFVARWGGEEFLLTFDRMHAEAAYECLQKLLEKIRNTEIIYQDQSVKATMTFGLTESSSLESKQLIHEADEKLYRGKSGGRNQIVV